MARKANQQTSSKRGASPFTRAARAKRGPGAAKKREIEQYDHDEAMRLNNPDVGLIVTANDPDKASATKIAVKFIDDRGIKSLCVMETE